MSRKIGSWLLGIITVVMLAGAVTTPADAQVVVRVGPRRHYHHRHYYYRHGRRYYR